jgi:polar amino acid transport system substrate-binding protein
VNQLFLNSRSSLIGLALVVALGVGGCTTLPATLAPTGSLRVGVYQGSPSSIIETPGSEPRGVGYDLGREMAARLGVPFKPVVFSNNGLALAAAKRGDVDVVFTNASPERARDLDFSPTFMDVGKSFLVPAGSASTRLVDMNRAGLRVGVSAGSSTAVELAPLYPLAAIVLVPTLKEGIEMLRSGQLDAFATNKAILFEMSDSLPGSRVLDGNWGMEHFAAGIPKGRERGDGFMAQFIDRAVRESLVSGAVHRAGLRGAMVPWEPSDR